MRRDIPFEKWGHSIRVRSTKGGDKKAIAAVARRMCVGGYHVLRTQKPYDDSKSDYKAAQTSFFAVRDQRVLKKHWDGLSVK